MRALRFFLISLLALAAGGAPGQVEKPPDPFGGNPPPLRVGLIAGPGNTGEIEMKLRQIRIPRIDFVETPLEDALEFLRMRAAELDDLTADPAARGINIVTRTSPGWGRPGISLGDDKAFSYSASDSPTVTMQLKNFPLGMALRHIAEVVGLEMRVESEAVVLSSPGEGVASVVEDLGDAGAAVEGWNDEQLREGPVEFSFPRTGMLEALQSEYRRLKALEGRLRGEEKEANAARLEVTQRTIERIRKLVLDFWEAERLIGEIWIMETARG